MLHINHVTTLRCGIRKSRLRLSTVCSRLSRTPRRARCRQLQACRRGRNASQARLRWLRRARESSFRRHWVRRRIFAFGGGGRVEVFMECWSATELGPRSRRARDRRAAPSRGGMRRNILQAKTLLTHPSGRRLSFSRYWARLKPRSESLARYVSCIQSSCILNTTPAVLKPAQACTVCASLSQGPRREKTPGTGRCPRAPPNNTIRC